MDIGDDNWYDIIRSQFSSYEDKNWMVRPVNVVRNPIVTSAFTQGQFWTRMMSDKLFCGSNCCFSFELGMYIIVREGKPKDV